jgi:hypothetical protein
VSGTKTVRKWFPSEFTWRLYVVLQVGTLICATVVMLIAFANSPGRLFRYQPVYSEVDPAEVEAARAKCAHLSDDPKDLARPKRWTFELELSPRKDCFLTERPNPRVVGQKYLGVDYDLLIKSVVMLLILFLLAFVVPFAVVRVPTWLLEGWRKGP